MGRIAWGSMFLGVLVGWILSRYLASRAKTG